MPTPKQQTESLHRSLTNQPPSGDHVVERFDHIRAIAKDLGDAIITKAPQSREQSLALTHLEETVMWAIKAIALHQEELD